MKYQSTMLVVKDIHKSKEFYKNILGLDVIGDFGENVILTNNIALQDLNKWKEFIDNKEVILNGNDKELYFEEDNFEDIVKNKDQSVTFTKQVYMPEMIEILRRKLYEE